mgnify:CR=1 FL=1
MAMNTGQFQNLYTRRIDVAFFEGWDEETEQWSRTLKEENGRTNNYTEQILAGGSAWESKAENANPNEQRFKQGPLLVRQFDAYGVEVIMSREQIADELWNEVENMARDQGRAGRERVEDNCAQFFQSLYDTPVVDYDNQPIFSDAHPNFGDIGGTQDNLMTGALTDGNLKSAIILFRKQRDEGGKKISSIPRTLTVPQSLQFTAATILQSALQAGTGNNDKNVLPNLELVVNDYWDVYTQTRWFLTGPRHRFFNIWREKVEFNKFPVMNKNGSQSWLGYLRHTVAAFNWRHSVGSTGV